MKLLTMSFFPVSDYFLPPWREAEAFHVIRWNSIWRASTKSCKIMRSSVRVNSQGGPASIRHLRKTSVTAAFNLDPRSESWTQAHNVSVKAQCFALLYKTNTVHLHHTHPWTCLASNNTCFYGDRLIQSVTRQWRTMWIMQTNELAWPHDKPGGALETVYRGSVKSSVQQRHPPIPNTLTQHEINSRRLHSAADKSWTIKKCWISGENRGCFCPSNVSTGSGVLPASYWTGTGEPISGVKRPECDVDKTPST